MPLQIYNESCERIYIWFTLYLTKICYSLSKFLFDNNEIKQDIDYVKYTEIWSGWYKENLEEGTHPKK